MYIPSEYEELTYKGRLIDDAQSPDYCGSCSIDTHIAQMRDPASWVHSLLPIWEETAKRGYAKHDIRGENAFLKKRTEDLEKRLRAAQNCMICGDGGHICDSCEHKIAWDDIDD